MGRGAVGMEVGRSVIALDHGDAAAGPEQPLENRQGRGRPREVLEDETDEHVVEGLSVEGQGEDVGLPDSTLVSPALSTLRLASAIESAETSTEVNRAPGLRS